MKKIISGKVYNTETAEFLGEDSYSNITDWHYYSEELYRTKKGAYFMHGKGNGLSKYGEHNGDFGYCPGETIEVISEDEARAWAEEHMSAEEYMELFEVEEG